MEKIPVAVLGATGVVGQHYLNLLDGHPWFKVVYIAASAASAGKPYHEAVGHRWQLNAPLPSSSHLIVHALDEAVIDSIAQEVPLVFSALNNEEAARFEKQLARKGVMVASNASFHRMDPDVPLLIPEVNSSHLQLIERQRQTFHSKKGGLVVKPNCTLQSFLLPLAVIDKQWPLQSILVTALQAVSGAGYPGHAAIDLIDNLLPFLPGEEEKNEREPLKILGLLDQPRQELKISVQCTRVPITDGHTTLVSFQFKKDSPSLEEIKTVLSQFKGEPQELNLPSAPLFPILISQEDNRPQPRLDRMAGKGMSVTVGRLRPCPVLDYRFVSLSHNTIRGAAGGGILNAELLVAKGYL